MKRRDILLACAKRLIAFVTEEAQREVKMSGSLDGVDFERSEVLDPVIDMIGGCCEDVAQQEVDGGSLTEAVLAAAIVAYIDHEGLGSYHPDFPMNQAKLYLSGVRDVQISDITFQVVTLFREIGR